MNNALEKVDTNIKKEKKSSNIYPLWVQQLNRNEKGYIRNNFNNFKSILENDEEFTNKIKFNEFNSRTYFEDKNKLTLIDDNVITDILVKIEKKYDGINNRKILEQVVDLVAEQHKFNPIINYLNSLKWDGTPRLATALSDYFGCEHSRYNEYCFRVFLNGAIARVLNPRSKI